MCYTHEICVEEGEKLCELIVTVTFTSTAYHQDKATNSQHFLSYESKHALTCLDHVIVLPDLIKT